MRALIALWVVLAAAASAQTACEAKCNREASDCIRACTGDPKDAQRPEQQGKLMQCLGRCEAKTKMCKDGCGKKVEPGR